MGGYSLVVVKKSFFVDGWRDLNLKIRQRRITREIGVLKCSLTTGAVARMSGIDDMIKWPMEFKSL